MQLSIEIILSEANLDIQTCSEDGRLIVSHDQSRDLLHDPQRVVVQIGQRSKLAQVDHHVLIVVRPCHQQPLTLMKLDVLLNSVKSDQSN